MRLVARQAGPCCSSTGTRAPVRDIEADLRPFHAWEFFDGAAPGGGLGGQVAVRFRRLGVPTGRVAVDNLEPVAVAALAAEGYEVVEAGSIVMDARDEDPGGDRVCRPTAHS